MVQEVDTQQALERQRAGALVIDVRDLGEWAQGHVTGAEHIPLADLLGRLNTGALAHDREIVFICASGARSYHAATLAAQLGYGNVSSVAGGTSEWAGRGLPIERGA